MTQRAITAAEASALLTELRGMALLPPGQDDCSLTRAREICSLLQAQQHGGRTVAQAADRTYRTLEILLSRRRWKQEAPSVEALRKQIRSACDQLRVTVESVLSERRPV
jgi:uncharacterized protein (DUF3084 family)